jgi:hypothetical protein
VDVQRQPLAVDDLVRALRPILRSGLPVDPELDDDRLLGLRGVVARAIDPDERLSRVKLLDGLLRKLLAYYPDDFLSEAARVLFGLTPGTRGRSLTERREQAARETNYEADHFRKRIEPKILRQLAWQLHQDSQHYIPRTRETPPPLEISGDTPYISVGDVSAKDKAEHEEALSRLWAHVYAPRAEILSVERLKSWPYAETEPLLSEQKPKEALAARDQEVDAVKALIQSYVDRYGESIAYGEGEFSARALLRIVHWQDSLLRVMPTEKEEL